MINLTQLHVLKKHINMLNLIIIILYYKLNLEIEYGKW